MKFFQSALFYFGLLLLNVICFISCNKKKINPQNIQVIESNTTNDLQNILFLNDSVGYIVGGVRYAEARILETHNSGNSWTPIVINGSLENKSLYGITHFDNSVFVVGLDGKFFKTKASDAGNWQFTQSSEWDWFHNIAFATANKGFIVYGVAFHSGGILKIDSNGTVLQKDTFSYELDDVAFVNSTTGYACGYGAIMKTSNQGTTWELMDIQGDFFKSISCPDNQNVWSVGYNGSIVHSRDAGNTWEKQRNGNNPLLKRWRLRAVKFKDSQTGYAVGDNGLIIKTTDGGHNWKIIESDQKGDFLNLFLKNNALWIVGANGIILKIIE